MDPCPCSGSAEYQRPEVRDGSALVAMLPATLIRLSLNLLHLEIVLVGLTGSSLLILLLLLTAERSLLSPAAGQCAGAQQRVLDQQEWRVLLSSSLPTLF